MSAARRAQGYATIIDPAAGRPVEMDTFTCCHCQTIVFMHNRDGTRADPGGFCRLCFRQCCGPCADSGTCQPFERKLERSEARARLLRQIGVE